MTKRDQDSVGDMTVPNCMSWHIPIKNDVFDYTVAKFDAVDDWLQYNLAMLDSMYQDCDKSEWNTSWNSVNYTKNGTNLGDSRGYRLFDNQAGFHRIMNFALERHNFDDDSGIEMTLQAHREMVSRYTKHDPEAALVVWVQ